MFFLRHVITHYCRNRKTDPSYIASIIIQIRIKLCQSVIGRYIKTYGYEFNNNYVKHLQADVKTFRSQNDNEILICCFQCNFVWKKDKHKNWFGQIKTYVNFVTWI